MLTREQLEELIFEVRCAEDSRLYSLAKDAILAHEAALRAEVEGLKAELIASNLHVKAEQDSVLNCGKKVADLAAQLAASENEHLQAVRDRNSARELNVDLSKQIVAIQSTVDSATGQSQIGCNLVTELEAKLAAMTGERDDFKEALVSMTTARILTEDAAQLLKEQLTAMTQERDALRMHHQKTQEALGICGGVFGSPAYHITILKQTLTASEGRVKELDTTKGPI